MGYWLSVWESEVVWIFDCRQGDEERVSAPNPQVVQESTVFLMFSWFTFNVDPWEFTLTCGMWCYSNSVLSRIIIELPQHYLVNNWYCPH